MQVLRSTRRWIALFILGLVLSGVTAFPLVHETSWLVRAAQAVSLDRHLPALNAWLVRVETALADTSSRYPFLAYGTDWLAFGHLVIAVAFVGPWRDPVRNRWMIDVGLIACAGVIVLAFTAGPVRGIPIYWRLIDSSFGLFGAIPLAIVRRKIDSLNALEALQQTAPAA
ncbi:hypothetical protein [Bryocella elongata]|uniref:hypothetical protein n=1 Tax=Bryocella elongata TaxID=863522 RepID=UPI0038992111